MKKALTFILSLVVCNLYAQNKIDGYEIGRYVDMNKQVINGYFDFSYEPEKSLNVYYTIGADFTPGYYYDTHGEKISGLLKYSQYNTFFKFKETDNHFEVTIKPDDCIGYVIGVDSFAVIEDFDIQREMVKSHSNKKEFAEVIDKLENVTFYKHTRAGLNNIVTTYIYKVDGESDFISFPKGIGSFKTAAIEAFGEFESLKIDIEKGKYIPQDVPTLIKLLKYKEKYDAQEKIYFNSSWDEIESPDKHSYYATISSLEDSVFHLQYHLHDGRLIYEGDYTSFYPHRKTGEFVWYHPNGVIRKKTNYKDNKPANTETFFTNGKIHLTYRLSLGNILYDQVNDTNGNNILDESGNGVDIIYDSTANRQITYEYVNHQLANVFYVDSNGKKIYQLCEKNAKLKGSKPLQSKLTAEVDYPLSAVKDFDHGYLLVKCIVEPSGLTSDLQVIKGISPDCNTTILNFLDHFKTYNQWKPGKVGSEKVTQEIIIPIDFSIQGFSRYRNHYNDYWMHHHMMHQQMMMQQIHTIQAPPSMPARF